MVRITAKGMRWQRTGHPWLYRDDLVGAKLPPGELVAVAGPQDRFLGQAFYSANSRIALRFVTYVEEAVDTAFWEQRLRRALEFRRRVVRTATPSASFTPKPTASRVWWRIPTPAIWSCKPSTRGWSGSCRRSSDCWNAT